MPTDPRPDSARELARHLRGMDVAMLTTVDVAHRLHSRPMLAQQLDADGDLWFFTARDTYKVGDIAERPQVNVAYALPREGRFVSIAGRAELVDDRAKAQQLWKSEYRAWFPDGLDDPDLVLLRVRVESAQCWEGETMIHIPGQADLASH